MKALFKNIPRQEGDSYEDNAYIAFGKCFKATHTIERLPEGTALDHDRVWDGWYLLFNLPFAQNRKYVCANTFEDKEGLCRPRFIVRVRKVGQMKNYSLMRSFIWKPDEIEAVVRYDDPYLSALKTTNIIKGK